MDMMIPAVDRLMAREFSLRVDLQEAQDIVEGLEELIDILEENNDEPAAEAVSKTLVSIMNQLGKQGVMLKREE